MVFDSDYLENSNDWSKRVPDDGEMEWTRYDNENVQTPTGKESFNITGENGIAEMENKQKARRI